MTAIRDRLQHSATGRHALEVFERYGVQPTFTPGIGNFFDPATNKVNLDPGRGDGNNTSFVHEMNHAQGRHEGTSADASKQSRADYVDTELITSSLFPGGGETAA